MRSDAELRAFYRDELRARLLAWKRLTRVRPLGPLDVAVLVAAAAACAWLRRFEPAWAALAYGVLRVARDVSRVRSAFKTEVLTPLFAFALPGVRYDPDARIPSGVVHRSGLFPEGWTSESGEDYVAGRQGDTEFRFSELRLVRRRQKQYTVVFRGLFFAADFNKSFRGETYLLPDLAERVFGTLGRSLQALPRFDGTELVELEDPEFEKRFVCYASDPVEARYLLSPSLVQRILAIAERASGSLRLSFVDGSLYLALPASRDLLPAAFFASSVDPDALLARVHELSSLVGLVEELDLNTRIWTKGPSTT